MMTPLTEQTARDLEVVRIDDLEVDHSYQRALDQNLVERILADWDFAAADAITVSKRADGSLWIVNGQHRAAAAKLAGETEMLAFIYEGLTVAQESDLRLKSNNRRPDTPLERFYAQMAAGRPESLAIQALLGEFGTQINRAANSYTGVNCVATVESLYRDDPEVFRRTLRALVEAHEEVKGDVATTPVLRGVFWFLGQHRGEYQWRSLIERMQRFGVEDLMRKARSQQSVNSGALWINYYRALVEAYNYKRPEHTRLETSTKHWRNADSRTRFSRAARAKAAA